MEDVVYTRWLCGLVADMQLATRLAKTAKEHHVGIRNIDKSEALIQWAIQVKPSLVILDFEKCEAEAFKTLKGFKERDDLKKTAIVGFMVQQKSDIQREAEAAGCLRVYGKTELIRTLDDLILRYVK